jgi:hypothetical protein
MYTCIHVCMIIVHACIIKKDVCCCEVYMCECMPIKSENLMSRNFRRMHACMCVCMYVRCRLVSRPKMCMHTRVYNTGANTHLEMNARPEALYVLLHYA